MKSFKLDSNYIFTTSRIDFIRLAIKTKICVAGSIRIPHTTLRTSAEACRYGYFDFKASHLCFQVLPDRRPQLDNVDCCVQTTVRTESLRQRCWRRKKARKERIANEVSNRV